SFLLTDLAELFSSSPVSVCATDPGACAAGGPSTATGSSRISFLSSSETGFSTETCWFCKSSEEEDLSVSSSLSNSEGTCLFPLPDVFSKVAEGGPSTGTGSSSISSFLSVEKGSELPASCEAFSSD